MYVLRIVSRARVPGPDTVTSFSMYRSTVEQKVVGRYGRYTVYTGLPVHSDFAPRSFPSF